MTFDTEKLIRKFSEENSAHSFTEGSESVHYSKPIDKGQITELQPDFEVKSVTDKESYDMIYKAGYMEALNHLETYIAETRGIDWQLKMWINQQRKTLNSYL